MGRRTERRDRFGLPGSESPCLCGCLLSPPCRSNPSKLIQLLTWNKTREHGRKTLPEIAVIPSARGKSRQPAGYSPHVTACVRREESKQKPERKYHAVLLYRYRDLLSFDVNNAVNNITAGAVIAELHKTNKLGCLQDAFKPKIPLNVALSPFPAQQIDVSNVCNHLIPKSFLLLRVSRALQALTWQNTTHRRIHKVQYRGYQQKYTNDLWSPDVLSSQLLSEADGGESSWTTWQKISFSSGAPGCGQDTLARV